MIDMNSKEQVINKLKELQLKNLPKMNIESFSKIVGDSILNSSDDEKSVINGYLAKYYDHTITRKNKCLFSDKTPSLNWSLAHGEMFDSNTGLNWTYYHYLTINGEEKKFSVTLQYHPDCYSIDE